MDILKIHLHLIPMIEYTAVRKKEELIAILDLQKKNLPQAITAEESQSQGFVTVHHDLPLLEKMNHPHPHIIAKDGDQVIGYALVMMRDFEQVIPVLRPMFEKINHTDYQGINLGKVNYLIMGQVCVDKPYRGQGVFAGLYQEMQRQLARTFPYLITEVSIRNTRSMRAHEKVGFETIKEYKDATDDWALILWDWKQKP